MKTEEGALSVKLLKALSRQHRWREMKRGSAPLCLNSLIDLLLYSSLVPHDLFRIQTLNIFDHDFKFIVAHFKGLLKS